MKTSIKASLAEDYIEQFFECDKKIGYRDLSSEDELVTALYEELPHNVINGIPVASDFIDKNGDAYSYEEFATLSAEERAECSLRYFFLPPYHTIIIGTTGSGKTTGCTEPMLRAMSTQKNKPNFFITDPKGEQFDRNVKHLKEQGYRVFVLNFKDPMNSDRWNPLLKLYDLKAKIIKTKDRFEKYMLETELDSQINQLVAAFVIVKNERDPSWEQGAAELLKGILHALLENVGKKDGGFTRDMMNIMSVYHYYNALKKEFIVVDSNSSNSCANHALLKDLSEKTRNMMSIVLDNANNTKRNFFGQYEICLRDWFMGHIFALTTGNTINFDEDDDTPFAIFLITRDYEKSDFVVAGLFIDTVYKEVLMRAERSPNGRNERATHFLLDEFGNIPKIESFDNKIATSRSRNIWFTLSVQSYMQLEVVYGKERSVVIRDNCNSQVFLGSQNRDTKEIFSKECGKHTIPTLSALYNDGDHGLNTIPLVPVSQLDLIKPGEMYIKRVYKNVFVSSFVRSYQAAEAGVYKDFGDGFKDELPCCEKGFDAPEYTFIPKVAEGSSKSRKDIFDW